MLKSIMTFTLVISLLFFFQCNKSDHDLRNIINEEIPLLNIGSDEEDLHKSLYVYKYIEYFYVDSNNNIYISDIIGKKIDKFSKDGNFICSIGRIGQGPGEFSDVVPFFAVDSDEVLYASYLDKIIIFSSDGAFRENVYFPERLKNWRVLDIKADAKDNVFLLFFHNLKFEIIKLDKNLKKFISIHKNYKRAFDENHQSVSSAVGLFKPDFDFDSDNNIYITDNVDYIIYIYSQSGELLNQFQFPFKKLDIKKRDLIFPTFKGSETIKLPDSHLKTLKGIHKYLPAIFGINVDNDKIYIWTSNQDNDYKFIIDIYDKNFRRLLRSSYYNNIRGNLAVIKNNIFYITNIQNDDMEFKKSITRCALFNLPFKVQAFEVNYDE